MNFYSQSDRAMRTGTRLVRHMWSLGEFGRVMTNQQLVAWLEALWVLIVSPQNFDNIHFRLNGV